MHSEDIENYASSHTSPERKILQELNRETHLKKMYPSMLAGHLQGKMLELISCMVKPLAILEIGTFTGYSTICLAKGLHPGGHIYTIERNDELEETAMKYFIKAGIQDCIVYYKGEAADIIPSINEDFDLVYIDGDKKDYPLFYNLVIDKVKPGGLIIADNVLWYGKVINDQKCMDKDTLGIHRFNETVNNDARVENLLLPLRDGLMLIQKRGLLNIV